MHNELRKKFNTLVRNLNRPDVRTLEALLTDVCLCNRDAGLMLARLLTWLPKSKHKDGWVYKSHRDWWAECRIPQNALMGANNALAYVGVEIILKKANGAPCKHYRLTEKGHDRLMQIVAKRLNLPVETVLSLMEESEKSNPPNQPNANDGIGEMDLTESGNSITAGTSLHPSSGRQDKQHAAADGHSDEGKAPVIGEATTGTQDADLGRAEAFTLLMSVNQMMPEGARHLAGRHDLDRILRVVSHAKNAKTLKNPAGWVFTELETGKHGVRDSSPLPPTPLSQLQQNMTAAEWREWRLDLDLQWFRKAVADETRRIETAADIALQEKLQDAIGERRRTRAEQARVAVMEAEQQRLRATQAVIAEADRPKSLDEIRRVKLEALRPMAEAGNTYAIEQLRKAGVPL